MAVQNNTQRAGKIRGRISKKTTLGRFVEEEMRLPGAKGTKRSARSITGAAVARARRTKRMPKAPQQGGSGRTSVPSRGTFNLNQSNVKRKHEARR